VADQSNLKIEELASQRDPRWKPKPYPISPSQDGVLSDRSSALNLDKMQELLAEKERVKLEIERIEGNKSLTRQDKVLAVKSVRSLSKTIEGLIGREKEKISDRFESQVMSHFSNINVARQNHQDTSIASGSSNDLKKSQII
jgi:hypothetical protein